MQNEKQMTLEEEKKIARENAISNEYLRLKEMIDRKEFHIFIYKMSAVIIPGILFFVVMYLTNSHQIIFASSEKSNYEVSGVHFDVAIGDEENILDFNYFGSKIKIVSVKDKGKSYICLGRFISPKRAFAFKNMLVSMGIKSKVIYKYNNLVITVDRVKEILSNPNKHFEIDD